MGANDPQGVESLDPRVMVWQDICRGPLEYTKIYGPHDFREEDCLRATHYKSPRAWAVWTCGA